MLAFCNDEEDRTFFLVNDKMQKKYMKLIFLWFGCSKIYTPQSLINNFWSKLFPVISHFLCSCISSSASLTSPSPPPSPPWSSLSSSAKELWFQTRQVHLENCSSEYQESHWHLFLRQGGWENIFWLINCTMVKLLVKISIGIYVLVLAALQQRCPKRTLETSFKL